MTSPYSKVLSKVPAMTPFVGPEAIERRRGRPFRLRLGANESAFGLSPKVRAAIAEATAKVPWYCDPEHFDLRAKLARRLGVAPSNLVVGEGIDGLLGLIVRAFVDPGDTVVTSAGAYPTFNYHVIGYGGHLKFVPYTAQASNDAEALVEAARHGKAKLLYLSNPDNPTGSFLDPAAISHILERLPEGCVFVLDEAYAEFAPQEDLPPMDAADPRVIRLRTFSKTHGLAGMRVGYGIAAAETIAAFDKIRLHFGVGRLSQVAAAAALDDPGFETDVVCEVAAGRRDYEDLGRSLNIATLASLTNFLAFDFETGDRAARMLTLLEERDVFVRRPGVAPLDRFVRVTVGTAAERADFAETLRDAVRDLG
jgi:histidinol-phosphate aminotransferase